MLLKLFLPLLFIGINFSSLAQGNFQTPPKVNLTQAELEEAQKLLIDIVLEEAFKEAEGNTYPHGKAPYEPRAMFSPFHDQVSDF